MTDDNGQQPPVRFQVIVQIDETDRLVIIAPNLPPDRVQLILSRANDYFSRELLALRTVEMLLQAQRSVQIAPGTTRLPPPPGRP